MPDQKRRKNVRNVAIIAHVDHGKTTLIDALLKQTGAYEFKDGETAIMDSNPLEKERGITIFSKNASFLYKGQVPGRKSGVQISMNNGKAVAYGLFGLQERGEIFVNPGDDVYEGMIIGVNNKGHDLVVNTLGGKSLQIRELHVLMTL